MSIKQARRACHTEGSVPYLMALEEGRDFQGFSNGLQPVPVGDLRTEGITVSHSVCVCVGVGLWHQIYLVHQSHWIAGSSDFVLINHSSLAHPS